MDFRQVASFVASSLGRRVLVPPIRCVSSPLVGEKSAHRKRDQTSGPRRNRWRQFFFQGLISWISPTSELTGGQPLPLQKQLGESRQADKGGASLPDDNLTQTHNQAGSLLDGNPRSVLRGNRHRKSANSNDSRRSVTRSPPVVRARGGHPSYFRHPRSRRGLAPAKGADRWANRSRARGGQDRSRHEVRAALLLGRGRFRSRSGSRLRRAPGPIPGD